MMNPAQQSQQQQHSGPAEDTQSQSHIRPSLSTFQLSDLPGFTSQGQADMVGIEQTDCKGNTPTVISTREWESQLVHLA